MLSVFLAAAVTTVPAEKASSKAATASAQALVRIVRGAEVRFGQSPRFEAAIPRKAVIRDLDGSTRTASLIEFY